jgi:hypothetical protein
MKASTAITAGAVDINAQRATRASEEAALTSVTQQLALTDAAMEAESAAQAQPMRGAVVLAVIRATRATHPATTRIASSAAAFTRAYPVTGVLSSRNVGTRISRGATRPQLGSVASYPECKLALQLGGRNPRGGRRVTWEPLVS